MIFRYAIMGLLIYIGYKIFAALTQKKETPQPVERQRGEETVTHRDPVCGVYVSEDDAVIGRYDGQRHYFCSHACLEKFTEQLEHK